MTGKYLLLLPLPLLLLLLLLLYAPSLAPLLKTSTIYFPYEHIIG